MEGAKYTGKVVPHGIYNLQGNEGFITTGTSHEPTAFIAENLLWWWDNFGRHHYPGASVILVLCNAGGANSYRHPAFKQHMLALATTERNSLRYSFEACKFSKIPTKTLKG